MAIPTILKMNGIPGAKWAAILACLMLMSAGAARAADPLAEGFRNPPRESRPETWFHLIGGNVTKPGLTTDLEAIAGAGFSGIQLFHGSGGVWPGIAPQVPCLSPQWDGMIGHVADECRRLGLRFTMQNCPGWSMSGGPWITPGKAMRELIWSRRDAQGGAPLKIGLPRPQPSGEDWRDYRDIAVLAFPSPAGDDGQPLKPVSIKSNRANLPWADLLAGKNQSPLLLTPEGEPAWVEVGFAAPVTLRSLELRSNNGTTGYRYFDPGAALRIQAPGPGGWQTLARRKIPRGTWQDRLPLTLALPEHTATTFRIVFELQYPFKLASLNLSPAARIDDWQGQACFVLRSLDRAASAPAQTRAAWIEPEKILDLSKNMTAGGRLDWDAPAGHWTILRLGHVNSGRRNAPAPPEATGFECNKLSPIGADTQFANYIGRISAPGGPAGDGRLNGMLLDSWECYTQTWTPSLERDFAQRRGYALRAWMPALAGYVVGDPQHSERFLRDWRATLNDLLVDNFFGRLAAKAHERGMKVSFETAIGDIHPGDILQYFNRADIPMCEFWQPNDPDRGGLETKPILPCASAAHVYGKRRIAAESFTSLVLRWNEHPFMLKHLADEHFTEGLNHLVFHTYTHNPRQGVVPGTSFGGGIGTPFLRGQTWWKQMPAFTTYLGRCQFMLEQGRPVADVLWFLGDDLDHKPPQAAPFPAGYRFDYLNPDVLQHRLRVADGQLATPEGLTWKVLWLRDCPRLTPETLARLRDLLRAGATVVGAPPRLNASLAGGPAAEARFAALVREIWGEHPAAQGQRKIGAGRLIWGEDLGAVLARLKLEPDVSGARSATWCHRRAGDTDYYFIAAARDRALRANLGFRAQGRPELWDPLTGARRPVRIFQQENGRTVIPLDLPAAGSIFVVFRPGAAAPLATRIERDGTALVDAGNGVYADQGSPDPVQGLNLDGVVQPWVEHPLAACEIAGNGKALLAWESGHYRLRRGGQIVADATAEGVRQIPLAGRWMLSFPRGWDAPEKIELPELKPWSALSDPATRAFSGSATYRYTLKLEPLKPGQRVLLDLGRVAHLAEVAVNGQAVARLWTAPFRAEITPFLKAGVNELSVTVTNTWRNRLAYDAGLPEAQRKTWTLAGPPAQAPLEEAGLTGPVVLRLGREVRLGRP